MKQTAVEFLMGKLFDPSTMVQEQIEWFEQAKEIEKDQMVDFAFKYGDLSTREIADSFDKEYKTNEKMKTKSQTGLSFDVYKNYMKTYVNSNIVPPTIEEFIEKIKTDDEFAKQWGNFNYNKTFNTK